MRDGLLVLVFFLLSALGCKTPRTESHSELEAFVNDVDREDARKKFKKVLNDCIPLISAAVKGGRTIGLADDSSRQQVVDQFTNALVRLGDSDSEKSAFVLKSYYDEKGKTLQPCAGPSAEYVVTEFALQTNIISIVLGQNEPLRFTGKQEL